MKVLFHLNSMGRGGAERVVSTLANHFSEKGNEIVVATEWFSENEYPLAKAVKRVSVGLSDAENQSNRIKKIILRHTKLRSCIKQEKPNLVISFCNKANFRCAISMLGMKMPLIVSVRNDPQQDYVPYRFSTWLMQKKAKGCVFQTPDAMKYFSAKFQKRGKIIFNPLSDNYLQVTDTTDVRKKEIINVGRISSQKNQLLLVKAFAGIAEKYPDYVLKIYGDVQEQDIYHGIVKYVEEKRLQQRVIFMGAVSNIESEIKNSALFVLSSDYEGMPNALIEAMVSGIPVISTDCPCGGSRLLIEPEVSGKLVTVGAEAELEQAMDWMLMNPDKAEKMGKEAKKIKEKVNPEKIVQEWEKYIEYIQNM